MRRKKQREFVEFLDVEWLKYIINPLSPTAINSMNELIDRYVDAQMKEHVKNKINNSKVDEDMEKKLRWVLEFKDFFNSLN